MKTNKKVANKPEGKLVEGYFIHNVYNLRNLAGPEAPTPTARLHAIMGACEKMLEVNTLDAKNVNCIHHHATAILSTCRLKCNE